MNEMNKEQRKIYDRVMECVSKHVKQALSHLDEGECGGDCGGGDFFGGSDFGGVTSPYNTPYNTIGIGDPVPATFHSCGSGDRWDYYPFMSTKGTSSKKTKKGKKARKKAPTIYKKR